VLDVYHEAVFVASCCVRAGADRDACGFSRAGRDGIARNGFARAGPGSFISSYGRTWIGIETRRAPTADVTVNRSSPGALGINS